VEVESGDARVHDYAVEARACLVTLAVLMVLTIVTVGVSYLELPPAPAITLGLAVASLKAALVAAVFMHLSGERALVYWTLVLTAVLVLVLFALIIWADGDRLFGTMFETAFGEGLR
jgi:caa(3)-type oxidase subunit IV